MTGQHPKKGSDKKEAFFAQRIVQGSLYYQRDQCTIAGEIPEKYRKLRIVCFPQNG